MVGWPRLLKTAREANQWRASLSQSLKNRNTNSLKSLIPANGLKRSFGSILRLSKSLRILGRHPIRRYLVAGGIVPRHSLKSGMFQYFCVAAVV